MNRIGWAALALACLATTSASAQPSLRGKLADIAFLAGDWDGGRGVVADTGGTSTGRSRFTAETGGGVLLRRDHTELFDKTGKPQGGFDQMMWIYPEAGTLRADYADGQHLIHYDHADIVPGRSVTFLSAANPGAPTFRLTYTLTAPGHLAVAFDMAPPGGADFHPIAHGELSRGTP
jgi:hypothetical protein